MQSLCEGTTARRIERKYPLSEERLAEVIDAVGNLLPIYRHDGGGDWSSLRTVYLDTADRRCFREYLEALPVRKKIRIRRYGREGQFEQVCWVELKVKDRSVSRKRRFRVMPNHMAALLRGETIDDHVRDLNDEPGFSIYRTIRGLIRDQDLRPAVRVDYERMSFQDPENADVRMTIDRALRFRSSACGLAGELSGMVLELKYNGECPLWMPSLQRQLEIQRRKRFSKFARSMLRLEELREIKGLA